MRGRDTYQLASGLDPSETYLLHVIKISEAADGFGKVHANNVVSFYGLLLDAGAETAPLMSRPFSDRRVEFIGDSITYGAGSLTGLPSHGIITDPEFDCDGDLRKFYAASNYESYSAMLCRELEADCRYIAWGGIGAANNNDGTTSWLAEEVYQRTLGTVETADYDFTLWVPHLVVINLGQNDVSYVACCG